MRRRPTDGLRREVLPNGVTLLVQRRTTVRAASLVAHIRAGFLDEPDDLVGVSHVLEHMLFKGTPALAPGELAQRTKALGGGLNAYTSYDRTVYYMSAPSTHLDLLAALQADQVQHPLLDAEELRRELGVIIQEARRKLDSPGAVAGETLHELLYDVHRIRRWRIGQEARLEQLTRGEVAGYYASRYVPSRTIVSLVSDADDDEALHILRSQWGSWAGPVVDIPAGPAEVSLPAVRARRMNGDVALADLVLGWRGPGELDDDVPPLEIGAALLASGRGARLSTTLRDPGLVNGAGASVYGVSDAGIFSIGAELDPARLPDVLSIIATQVNDLAERPVSSAEFDRALALIRARTARRLERYESRAIALASAEALGDVGRLDWEDAEWLQVTPERVQQAMQRWVAGGVVSGIAYMPRQSDAPFDDAMLADFFRRRVAAPAIVVSAPDRHAPRVHHVAVGSVDLLTAQFGDAGQTSIGIYRMRDQVEDATTAGLAALGLRSMLRGTSRMDATALGFAVESLGGTLSPSLGADTLGIGTTVLTEHLATAAALLAEVLHAPGFDPAAIAIERQQLLDDARAVADDMVRFPLQLMLGVAFGDAGYGAPSLGTPESIASFTPGRLRHWHDTMLRGGRTTIVAVGDSDPEELAEQILAATAPWRDQHGEETAAVLTPVGAFVPGVRTAARDRQQSALAMLFPGPGRHDPARFAAETWSAIAGGLGGRLFESLRSARSLAYTVMASSWQRRRAGGLLTYIAMAPDRLDEARDGMLEELERFRREPPTPDEMTRASASLVGEIEMARQTAGAFASEIVDAWLMGEGLGALDDPAAPYRAVTAEAVHDVAARGFDPARRAEGVVTAIASE